MGIEFPDVFNELAAVLAVATAIGFAGLLLRQPLIVSFIVAGLVAGSGVIDIDESMETIELLAEVGIALLLFLVGLKLDLALVRSLGRVALATGLGQIAFTTIFGFLLSLVLQLDPVTSLYVAVALTFSSTIIIVKLLSDKREIDSLHGRIAIGFLIVQDLAVVAAMVVLSGFGVGGDDETGGGLNALLFGGPLLFAGLALFMYALAERLVRRMATSPEMLVTFGIGWAVLLAALFEYVGFGKELGGLVAGVSLASTSLREVIAARLSGLRDFLLLFFFLSLGITLELSVLGSQIPAAVVLSAFVLVGNPLIVLAIMAWLGYRKRTGFLAGLTVSQISEFSLIFIGLGVTIGHIDDDAAGLVTLVGLVTIALSTYAITYSDRLYDWIEPLLSPFERTFPAAEDSLDTETEARHHEVIVFGVGRYGGNIMRGLRERGHSTLGIDFDPQAVQNARKAGFDVIFGDALDPDFVQTLKVTHAQAVVLAFPPGAYGVTHTDPRYAARDSLRQSGFSGSVIAMTDDEAEIERLRANGIEPVLVPFRDAAVRAVDLIEEALAAPAR